MADTDLKVQIRFEATGDKELAKAFTSAANAEKKLEAALKRLKKTTDKTTRSTKGLGVAFHRLTKGAGKWRMSLATIRSKLLVATFGLQLFNRTLGVAIKKYQEQEKAIAMLNQTLRSTGFAARLSSRELQGLASRLQKLTGIGDETILSMQGILLTFTEIKGDIFKDATNAILDVSVAMGQDLKQSAIQVGKALNDPRIGVTALSRVGIQFTDTQKAMIKKFAETNQIAKAQRIILSELEIQFGGTAANLDITSAAFNRLSSAWGDFLETGGGKMAGFLSTVSNFAAEIIETANVTEESRMNEIFSVIDEDATKAAAASMHLGNILDQKILLIMKEIGFAADDLDLQELFSDENKDSVIEFGEAIRDNPNKFLKETLDRIRELKDEPVDVLSGVVVEITKQGGNIEKLLGESGALGFQSFSGSFGKAADEAFAAADGDFGDIQLLREVFTQALDNDNLSPGEIKDIEDKFGKSFKEIVSGMITEDKISDLIPSKDFGLVLKPLTGIIGELGLASAKGFAAAGADISFALDEFDMNLSPFADILNKIFSVDDISFEENQAAIDQLYVVRDAIMAYMEAAHLPIGVDDRSFFEKLIDQLAAFKKDNPDVIKGFDDMAAAGMAFSKGNKGITITLLRLRQALAFGNILTAFSEEWKDQNYAKAFSILAVGMMKIQSFKEQINAAREAAIGADFITQGRQTLVVGDNPSGRERVQVTPLGNAGGGGATSSGVVVNINGNILGTDEFVRDTLIPSLEDSLGRNLA